MGNTIRTESVKTLFEAILTLENVEECFDFFEDVCTVKEVQSIAQRFAVAKMLKEQHTYLEVAKETGASTATISRVNSKPQMHCPRADTLFPMAERH